MSRNIKTLFNFEPPASELEIHDASLRFVRKLSGFKVPSPGTGLPGPPTRGGGRIIENRCFVLFRHRGSAVPLPPPQPRQPMHTRKVEYRGFERDDGLWDIEGELLDTKPHAFMIEGEREWAPNEPIHHMSLRVTVDGTMVIRDIAVAMHAHPHDPCTQAMPPMQGLIGETLGRGWRKTIERHLGGTQGCTHLRELLFNLATAAFQTRSASFAPPPDGRPPMHLGQCKAWAFDGPVVEKVYPMFFRWQSPDAAPR